VAKKLICSNCGYIGKPKNVVEGSIFIEIILWLAFIIPGVVYSIWRETSGRKKICPKCRAPNMIPLDSPRGKRLIQEFKD